MPNPIHIKLDWLYNIMIYKLKVVCFVLLSFIKSFEIFFQRCQFQVRNTFGIFLPYFFCKKSELMSHSFSLSFCRKNNTFTGTRRGLITNEGSELTVTDSLFVNNQVRLSISIKDMFCMLDSKGKLSYLLLRFQCFQIFDHL